MQQLKILNTLFSVNVIFVTTRTVCSSFLAQTEHFVSTLIERISFYFEQNLIYFSHEIPMNLLLKCKGCNSGSLSQIEHFLHGCKRMIYIIYLRITLAIELIIRFLYSHHSFSTSSHRNSGIRSKHWTFDIDQMFVDIYEIKHLFIAKIIV